MSKTDRIKEEIGWLKLAFGVLAAVDASLMAWLAQNYTTTSQFLRTACPLAIAVVTLGFVWVNRAAMRRFEDLEDE